MHLHQFQYLCILISNIKLKWKEEKNIGKFSVKNLFDLWINFLVWIWFPEKKRYYVISMFLYFDYFVIFYIYIFPCESFQKCFVSQKTAFSCACCRLFHAYWAIYSSVSVGNYGELMSGGAICVTFTELQDFCSCSFFIQFLGTYV